MRALFASSALAALLMFSAGCSKGGPTADLDASVAPPPPPTPPETSFATEPSVLASARALEMLPEDTAGAFVVASPSSLGASFGLAALASDDRAALGALLGAFGDLLGLTDELAHHADVSVDATGISPDGPCGLAILDDRGRRVAGFAEVADADRTRGVLLALAKNGKLPARSETVAGALVVWSKAHTAWAAVLRGSTLFWVRARDGKEAIQIAKAIAAQSAETSLAKSDAFTRATAALGFGKDAGLFVGGGLLRARAKRLRSLLGGAGEGLSPLAAGFDLDGSIVKTKAWLPVGARPIGTKSDAPPRPLLDEDAVHAQSLDHLVTEPGLVRDLLRATREGPEALSALDAFGLVFSNDLTPLLSGSITTMTVEAPSDAAPDAGTSASPTLVALGVLDESNARAAFERAALAQADAGASDGPTRRKDGELFIATTKRGDLFAAVADRQLVVSKRRELVALFTSRARPKPSFVGGGAPLLEQLVAFDTPDALFASRHVTDLLRGEERPETTREQALREASELGMIGLLMSDSPSEDGKKIEDERKKLEHQREDARQRRATAKEAFFQGLEAPLGSTFFVGRASDKGLALYGGLFAKTELPKLARLVVDAWGPVDKVDSELAGIAKKLDQNAKMAEDERSHFFRDLFGNMLDVSVPLGRNDGDRLSPLQFPPPPIPTARVPGSGAADVRTGK